MFTLAKLTSMALGVITLGSAGGIITPIVLKVNSYFFKKDNSKSNIDLSELEINEEAIKEELTNLKNKYGSALSWLEELKLSSFTKILEYFKELFKTEEDIRTKYQEIQTTIEKLNKLSEQKTKVTKQKWGSQRATNLFETYNKGFSELNKAFGSWRESFSKIVCALKNRSITEGKSCEGGGTSRSQSSASNGSSSQGTVGDTAKQSLEEIEKELTEMNKYILSVEQGNSQVSAQISKMQDMEKSLSLSLDVMLTEIDVAESSYRLTINVLLLKVQELFEKTKELTTKINRMNQELAILKKTLSMVKNYEGIFQNKLCSLHTIEHSECNGRTSQQ